MSHCLLVQTHCRYICVGRMMNILDLCYRHIHSTFSSMYSYIIYYAPMFQTLLNFIYYTGGIPKETVCVFAPKACNWTLSLSTKFSPTTGAKNYSILNHKQTVTLSDHTCQACMNLVMHLHRRNIITLIVWMKLIEHVLIVIVVSTTTTYLGQLQMHWLLFM